MPASSSSALLLRRQVQEPEEVDEGTGVRIASVDVEVQRMLVHAGVEGAHGPKGVPFNFDFDLGECGSTKDSLTVRFEFTFGRASGQACKVGGKAELRFARLGRGVGHEPLGHGVTNEMAVEIFRACYETIFLLHQSLGLEAPSPWITQQVSLASRALEIPA